MLCIADSKESQNEFHLVTCPLNLVNDSFGNFVFGDIADAVVVDVFTLLALLVIVPFVDGAISTLHPQS